MLEIPETLLNEIGITVRETAGAAPDPGSNDIHRSIECFGGSLLAQLLERLSDRPSLRSFNSAEVRALLVERIGAGLMLKHLKPQVVDDLLRSGLISEETCLDVLAEKCTTDRLVVSRLKAATVRALVGSGRLRRELAAALHSGLGQE